MLMVAICDDEIELSAQLERTLMEIFGKLNVEHEIDVYSSGVDLYKKIAAGMHYDLIFLDIEFAQGEINGVEVGRLIRGTHLSNSVSIVYISWESKYSMDLFQVRPLNFLIKPLSYDKVEQIVKTYLDIFGLLSSAFIFKRGHDTVKVPISDIIYLESHNRKLILHLVDGQKEEFYGSLKTVYEEQLKRFDFLFIHASYLVNYDHVQSISYNQLVLANSGASLSISQNRRQETRERCYSIMKRRRV